MMGFDRAVSHEIATGNRDIPILLFTGAAADERLFAAQKTRFPNLIVPKWIEPMPSEALAGYARRLAKLVDPGVPCIVGGASFGGVVALEVATHLKAVACVLIGSLRSPAELPWQWRLLGPMLGPRRLGIAARCLCTLGGWILPRNVQRRLGRISHAKAGFSRWATCALLNWQPTLATRRVRVFQIHGAADRTLPFAKRPDVLVPNGQHALPLYNASAVNEFLERVYTQVSSDL